MLRFKVCKEIYIYIYVYTIYTKIYVKRKNYK